MRDLGQYRDVGIQTTLTPLIRLSRLTCGSHRPFGIELPWHAMQSDGFFARIRSALKLGPCGLNPNPPFTAEWHAVQSRSA